jgi:hypothetical protein
MPSSVNVHEKLSKDLLKLHHDLKNFKLAEIRGKEVKLTTETARTRSLEESLRNIVAAQDEYKEMAARKHKKVVPTEISPTPTPEPSTRGKRKNIEITPPGGLTRQESMRTLEQQAKSLAAIKKEAATEMPPEPKIDAGEVHLFKKGKEADKGGLRSKRAELMKQNSRKKLESGKKESPENPESRGPDAAP